MGYPPCWPRRAGPALGTPQLRLLPEGRGRRAQDDPRACGPDGRRGSARQVPHSGDRSTVRAAGTGSGTDVRGIRRKSGEIAARQTQAFGAEEREPGLAETLASGLRPVADGPDRSHECAPLVRRVQPDGAGRGQPSVGPAPPDTEPGRRVRASRHEPDQRHQAQSPPEAHPLPLARGDPAPSPRVRPPCRRA